MPSPFKRNLRWPEVDNNLRGKKRKFREKMPFTVTGDQWREYHENKEAERKRIQEEKDKRSEARKERKMMKEKLMEEKKRKGSKKLNTKKSDDSSTDETDTEVQCCESDDSNYDIEDDSESENMALISFKKRITKGSYVIVRYEGEHFPGVVETVDKLSYEISTMTLSTGKTYKWPEKKDKIWYNKIK